MTRLSGTSYKAPLLLLLVAVLLLAVSCGGDDGEETLSKEEFIAQADAICAEANAESPGLAIAGLDPAEAADQWDEVVVIGQGALEELRALSPVEAEATAIDEILSGFEQAYAAVPDYTAALREGDAQAQAESTRNVENPLSAAQAFAVDYGFEECWQFGP